MVNFFVHIELRIVINSNVSKISEIVNPYIMPTGSTNLITTVVEVA